MVFYHGKRFDSARVGTQLMPVCCKRCGCEYFYELARIGSGGASAPYGFGQDAAARSAAEQSKRDLRTRLDHEAELVPCPRCHWINQDLVRGYRQSRYRGWGKFAAYSAFFGTIASLFCAWFVSVGPAGDRGALPLFLIYGPAVFIASAVAVLLLRNWLRGRIQPNKDDPSPPVVPHGYPPPLFMNAGSGALEVARVQSPQSGGLGTWVEFQLGRHELPPLCCECLLPEAPEHAYRITLFPAIELSVPRCSGCALRGKRQAWFLGLIATGSTIALGLGVLIARRLDEVVFWVFFGALCLVSPYLGAAFAQHRVSPVRVKIADASRGIVRLWFRNDEYRRCIRPGPTPASTR